jgi:DNA-binding FrmR family transcriptional regulator
MRNSKRRIEPHPDYSEELGRLRKIRGQMAGVEKMIVARRYCPEIIQQIRAATSALKALEIAIIKGHLSFCIKKSAHSDSPSALDQKLKELMKLIKG